MLHMQSCPAVLVFLSTPSVRRATNAFAVFTLLWLLFLSTPSVRRATSPQSWFFCVHLISIHALREEGDGNTRTYRMVTMHFYPRPP